MPVPIPDTHRDLLVEPIHGVLSTMMPDGQPQSSIVWADYDSTYVLISWIEVRGNVVEISRDGAEAHADKLTQLYTGKQRFYGDIHPIEQKQKETRVIVKIEPIRVALDAIFK